MERTERRKAAVLSLNESFSSLRAPFVQLGFLLFPGLLIRPPALPPPNLEPHRWVLRWEEAHLLLCVPILSFANTHTHSRRGRRAHAQRELIFPYIVMQAHSFKGDDGYCSRARLPFTSKFRFKTALGDKLRSKFFLFLSTNDNKVVSAVGKEEELLVVTALMLLPAN